MTTITAAFISADQNFAEETTIYWFRIEGDSDLAGKEFGIAESGTTSTVVDSDGAPLDYSDHDRRRVAAACIVTDEIRAKAAGFKR